MEAKGQKQMILLIVMELNLGLLVQWKSVYIDFAPKQIGNKMQRFENERKVNANI
jgi:hypothetical protein